MWYKYGAMQLNKHFNLFSPSNHRALTAKPPSEWESFWQCSTTAGVGSAIFSVCTDLSSWNMRSGVSVTMENNDTIQYSFGLNGKQSNDRVP